MAATMKKKRGEINLPQNFSLDPEQQKEFNQKVTEIKKKGKGGPLTSGVVYLGNIPHGFFEPQMRAFFTQFGKVRRLKLSRSKKTGRSKGYAFVEFQSDKVAQVVADTMNNYLMFERLLKCQYLPAPKVHPDTFRGSNRKFVFPKSHVLAIDRHNNVKKEKKTEATIKRFAKSYKKRSDKLKALGIDFHIKSIENAMQEGEAKLKQKKQSKREEKTASEGSSNTSSKTKTTKGNKEMKSRGDKSVPGETTQVLVEDSDEDEITFKTPPNTVRSSKILCKSAPVAKDKKSVKRLADKTPQRSNGKKETLRGSKATNKRKLLRKSV